MPARPEANPPPLGVHHGVVELGVVRGGVSVIVGVAFDDAVRSQEPKEILFAAFAAQAAQARGVEIVEPPRDLFYGQRRVLVRDPAGTLVGVSSECAPDPTWMARVKQAEDGSYQEEPGEG